MCYIFRIFGGQNWIFRTKKIFFRANNKISWFNFLNIKRNFIRNKEANIMNSLQKNKDCPCFSVQRQEISKKIISNVFEINDGNISNYRDKMKRMLLNNWDYTIFTCLSVKPEVMSRRQYRKLFFDKISPSNIPPTIN